MKLRIFGAIGALFLGGCTTKVEIGPDGRVPAAFASREEAGKFVEQLFAGGRIDEVSLGSARYFGLFQHGSGIPVLGFAEIYRAEGQRWKWIAKGDIPRFEFLKAEALDGVIVGVGTKSGRKIQLYDPKRD